MGYIQKLPFILASTITIIVGLVCYTSGASNMDTFVKMIISMTIFYLIGMYVRNLIIDIKKQVDENRKKEELERNKNAEKESTNIDGTNNKNVDFQTQTENVKKENNNSDEFTPLMASKVIKNSYLKTE